jgi:O-antigen/teichoic acid export membrane protein
MKNNLAKNTGIYTLGNILPTVVQFLLLPVYLKYMTPEDYGITSSLNTLTTLLIILFSFSLSRSIYRLYYDYNDSKRKEFIGTIGIGILITSSIGLAIVMIFKTQVGKLFDNIPFFPFYFYAILAAYFSLFQNIPKVFYVVKEKAVVFLFLSIVQLVTTNLFIGYFVVYNNLGAEGYLKGYLYGIILPLPLFIFLFLKNSKLTFKYKMFKSAILFSAPTVPNQIIVWVISLSNRVFIERYFTLGDVAIFALAFKITSLILIFATSFKKAYDPYFYKIANSLKLDKKILLEKSNNLYLVIILFVTFMISFISRELIYVFFDHRYYEAIYIIPILSLGFFVDRAQGILNLSFYQEKNTHIVMYISFIGVLVNLTMNYFLIPIYSIYGAAYAALITYMAIFIVKYLMAKKQFYINMYFVKHFGFLISSYFVILFINKIFDFYQFGLLLVIILKTMIIAFFAILLINVYSKLIPDKVKFRFNYLFLH